MTGNTSAEKEGGEEKGIKGRGEEERKRCSRRRETGEEEKNLLFLWLRNETWSIHMDEVVHRVCTAHLHWD